MIKLEIPGDPQGKRRARFCRVGHFVKTYTDAKTLNYETYIRELFCIAYPNFTPFTEELSIIVKAYQSIPKSTSNKIRAVMLTGEIRPAKKPEVDNILKVVMDALTGLAYKNDNQIVGSIVEKYYSERPRVEIELL